MARQQQGGAGTSVIALAVMTGGLIWLAFQLGPPVDHGAVRPWPALVWGVAAVGVLQLITRFFELLAAAADWKRKRTPTGKAGTAGWAKRRDYRKELSSENKGPFWGMSTCRKGVALFADYVSNAMTVAPAGAGKGECTVVNNLISIHHAKVVADFKGELICMVKKLLAKRGEINRVLNPGSLWSRLIGLGDCFNPMDIIVAALYAPGGLRDVMDYLREMALQIYPEPATGQSENSFFREGARKLIALVMLIEVMIREYDATLPDAALLLEDRQRLEDHLRWIAGVDQDGSDAPGRRFLLEKTKWAQQHDPEDVAQFAQLVRAQAVNHLTLMCADESRTFESFITGAQQNMAPLAFGRVARCMGRSTFSMDDLKEGDKTTNLFIVADASRIEAYKPFVGLIQWCCLTALKRHPTKGRPVYFLLDEVTNYKVNGLEDLLTWGRSYGLRLHLIFQDLAAFERTYGKSALDTLLSECEIKQFLPSQRSQKTLELISKMLSEQSVMSPSIGKDDTFSESGRPLLTPDEIRRTDKGILFVRRCKAIEFIPVSYSEIHPNRLDVDDNPFFGEPYLKPVKLRW